MQESGQQYDLLPDCQTWVIILMIQDLFFMMGIMLRYSSRSIYSCSGVSRYDRNVQCRSSGLEVPYQQNFNATVIYLKLFSGNWGLFLHLVIV